MKNEGLDSSVFNTPTCQMCNDLGVVYPWVDGKIDFSRTVPCKCQEERVKREVQERLMKYCDLPAHSEDKTFENYKPGNFPSLKLALQTSKVLAAGADKIRWLTLSGGRDRGKSHLAIAVCREWLKRDQPAKYVFVPSLLDWLRDAMNNKELNLNQRMKILCEVPLLVMDDLGVQKPTEWAMERLTTIINYRYENWLPLMVTTNKSVDNLPGDDEGRIGSRLKRFVPGTVIVMEGPEYITRRNKGDRG
jgi:DNA replication protein DnaC